MVRATLRSDKNYLEVTGLIKESDVDDVVEAVTALSNAMKAELEISLVFGVGPVIDDVEA